MIKIDLGVGGTMPIYGVVSCDNDEEKLWVRTFLTYQTKEFRGGKFYAKDHCYLLDHGLVQRGMIPALKREASASGYQVDMVDSRSFTYRFTGLDIGWLRDYQQAAYNAAIRSTFGVISAPTGSGKGEVITAIVGSVDIQWLVLVNNDDLVHDLGTRFKERVHERPGWIRSKSSKGKNYAFDIQRVVFATTQSTMRRMFTPEGADFLKSVRGVIVDECHGAASATLESILRYGTKNTHFTIGLSGTPFDRMDQRNVAVMASIGPCIHKISQSALVKQGAVSKPTIRMVKYAQKAPPTQTFAAAYRHQIVANKERNDLCARVMCKMAKPGIVFTLSKPHASILANLASSSGLSVRHVDGDAPTSVRQGVINAAKRGDLDIIVSTSVFSTGIDIADILSVFIAGARKAVINTTQSIGRGSRIASDGTSNFEVWDIYDVVQKHRDGAIDTRTVKTWMEDHAKERKAIYDAIVAPDKTLIIEQKDVQ